MPHVQLKTEKLQKSKYSPQTFLLVEDEMGNLEEWSSVMEEKMACFVDVVNRLKTSVSNLEKKEATKVKHEENIIQEDIFKRRMQEELKIRELKLQVKSKEYEKRDKILHEERFNVKLFELVKTKFGITSLGWFRFCKQFERE